MSLRPVLYVASPTRPVPNRPTSRGGQLAPSIESNTLLRGTCEVLIRHGGEVYRLRHTRNDTLMLTIMT